MNKQLLDLNRRKNRTDQQDQERKKHVIHDLHLLDLKNLYEQDLMDIKQYQKTIRKISYAYMNLFENTTDDDLVHIKHNEF